MARPLSPENMGAALESITAWRLDHDAPVKCPACAALGLKIIDQSSRPYAEWYALSCSACGLDATVQIPLAPP
jgi:hypothetical protein